MFLNETELFELTKKKHSNAQACVLNMLGINYKRRPDASIIISRLHVQQLFGANLSDVKLKQVYPDWSSINAKATVKRE